MTTAPIASIDLPVRVRYVECDPMGVVHHTVYPVWFEMARTELLRSKGGSYRAMEEAGLLLAVVRLEARYRAPARYDDLVTVRCDLLSSGPVKIEHRYQVIRDGALLVEGGTTLACIDRNGRLQAVPSDLAWTSR
ncbi:MAG: thioesterase family protein [Bacteroidia bacterium]|nr:thioesterase family protein [Bacteroidia bacterium]